MPTGQLLSVHSGSGGQAWDCSHSLLAFVAAQPRHDCAEQFCMHEMLILRLHQDNNSMSAMHRRAMQTIDVE